MAWPRAMSVRLRPRCHSRIRSLSVSRPGRSPQTIWPSSAYSVSFDSRPESTCARSAPSGPGPGLAPVVDDDLVHDVGQARARPRSSCRRGRPERRVRSTRCEAAARATGAASPRRRRRRRGRTPPSRRRPAPGRPSSAARSGGQRRAVALGARVDADLVELRAGRGTGGARSTRPCRGCRCGPSTRLSGRARCRAPTAVTAPVRMAVMAVASRIAVARRCRCRRASAGRARRAGRGGGCRRSRRPP